MASLKLIIVFAIAIQFQIAYGFDEGRFFEKKCSGIHPDIDMQWMGSIKKWHIPMWSKLHRVRIASDVLGKPVSDLTDNELAMDSCMIFENTNMIWGFKNKAQFDIQGSSAGLKFKAPWSGAKSGMFSFKLTDNESFILGVTCFEDGQSGWALLTVKPKLDESLQQQILGMVKGLGFTDQMVHYESYKNCGAKDGLEKNEL